MRRAVATLLVFLAFPAGALAADCPQTSLADVEDEVMCPVCGVPLELATEAPQAKRERAYIERLVADCKSKQEIKDLLVAQFGDRVLGDPPGKGFDAAAYVVPVAAVAVALAALAFGVGRRRRAQPAPALAGQDSARLDADLERYEL